MRVTRHRVWDRHLRRFPNRLSNPLSPPQLKSTPALPTVPPSDASDIKSILGDSVVNSVGLVLVPVPAEEFQIGVPESESVRDDDKLRHLVQITKPSSLCAYEVARKQYEKVMGNNPSYRKGENKQVNYVHWNDAIEFCCKLSGQEGVVFRLLTSDFGQTFNCSVALADATVAVVHTRRTILTTPPSVAAIMLV